MAACVVGVDAVVVVELGCDACVGAVGAGDLFSSVFLRSGGKGAFCRKVAQKMILDPSSRRCM